ncbi:MAG: putative cation:proton antiport protein [Methanocella sp. PtaU1.Bin125]|nr:MAG: putative cation:proton antiport protein [Methanocella sp. PtaU1.Bin125]
MSDVTSLILETLLTVCILLFGAKIGGELCKRFGIAEVIGELLAGVILAPTLFGGIILLGRHIVVLNDAVMVISEMGAVTLLFLVGLETSFANFRRSGFVASVVAVCGVIVPFLLGYGLTVAFGYSLNEAFLVGAALTATSIAITVKTLQDIGRTQTDESNVLIAAAVIDDVLGLIVLAIVLAVVRNGGISAGEITVTAATAIGFWLGLTLFGVIVISRFIDFVSPRFVCDSTCQTSAVAFGFGYAFLAGLIGLSPILGSFAAGMAVAETKVASATHEFTKYINFMMAPLFFVVIGAQVDLSHLTIPSIVFASILIVLAMAGKVIGCGVPILLMKRDARQATVVGLGMMSRGEVGLIIAGIGISGGFFSQDVFTAIILMVLVTTIVTPIMMSSAYKALDRGAT